MLPQRILQQLRRLQNILLSQHPSPPVHAQCPATLCVLENLNRVMRISVHGTHEKTRLVRANRDETQIERTSVLTDLFESRTCGICVFGGVVVNAVGQFWNGAITRVPYILG